MSESVMKHIVNLERQIRRKDKRIAELESALRDTINYFFDNLDSEVQRAMKEAALEKLAHYRATIESVLGEE